MNHLKLALGFVLSLGLVWADGAAAHPPLNGGLLSKEGQAVMGRAALDVFIQRFNREVHRPVQLLSPSFIRFTERDRKDAAPLIEAMSEAPKLSREGQTLVFAFKDMNVHVRWPDLTKNEIFIENVPWTYDPSAPLKPQLEMLQKKIKAQAAKIAMDYHFPLEDLIFPRAEAQIQAELAEKAASGVASRVIAWCAKTSVRSSGCTFVGMTVAGAVINRYAGEFFNGVDSLFCLAISGSKPWDTVGWCKDWKKDQDAAISAAKAKGVARPDRINPNIKWAIGASPECHSDSDTFSAWMAEVDKQPDGKWKAVTWFRFAAKLDKKGNFTSAAIYKDEAAEKAKTQMVQFTYGKTDDKGTRPPLESIIFQRKDFHKDDVSDTPTVPIFLTDQEKDVDPPYRDRAPKMVSLAESAQEWALTCRNLAFNGQFNRDETEKASQDMIDGQTKPTAVKPEDAKSTK